MSSTMIMLTDSSFSAVVTSSVPASTFRTLARRVIMAASGIREPLSHLEIVALLTNIRFASWICVRPFLILSFLRVSANRVFMASIHPPFLNEGSVDK